MKRKLKTVTSLGLISVMTLSGCSAAYNYDNIPYQPNLTKQEVMDYYATEMSYDAIVSRSMKLTKDINFNNVTPAMADKLSAETLKVIETHQLNAGYSAEMSQSVHDWLKLSLDDLVLTKKNGAWSFECSESQGFYFVKVPFDTHLNGAGTMKNEANYLGINGVIIQDQNEEPIIDESFLTSALIKMNDSRAARGLKPYEAFGVDLNYVRETEPTTEEETLPETDAEGNVIIGRDDETSEEETQETTQAETTTAPETLADFGNNSNTYVPETTVADENSPYRNLYANNVESRQLSYDVVDFNNRVGTSMEQMAAVPHLGMIYNPVNTNGDFSGYGVYQGGSYGLRDFGYNRDTNLQGSIELVFVFKQDPDDREKLNYNYCYIDNYQSNIDLHKTHMDKVINAETGQEEEVELPDEVILSDDINNELDKIIERADRAINNKDTSALMSQDIFEGSDIGLKWAVLRNSSNILTFMTKRVRTVERHTEDNRMYLVELERTTEEAPKGFGNTGKYKDKLYAVIRQQGQQFRINDVILVSRELQRIPEPDVDSSIVRRLTSLNLSGDVPKDYQEQIEDMMSIFYYAVDLGYSNDIKTGGNIEIKDGKAHYGFCDRFDSDTSLLNSDRRDYLQSQIVARWTKETNQHKGHIKGHIENWIGGYTDLVEFTTKELYWYEGLEKGILVTNYYLVNHYGTEWVIDDIVAISEEDVFGEEFNELKASFEVEGGDLGELVRERVRNNPDTTKAETQAETQAENK